MTHSDERTDEELVSLVREGDTALYGELMRRYEPKLARYGRRFLGDPDGIDDALQETFIRAYRNLKGFDVRQRFSPWMYRIAHNVFANALRAKARAPAIAVDLDTFLPHVVDEDRAASEREQAEMRKLIDAGLSKVSAAYREILTLYYFEELSYDEIADVLHIPVGTVGVRLARGRRALKAHIPSEHLP